MWKRWRSRIGFYLLGVVSTLLVAAVAVLLWNPVTKVEAERKWFNDRIQGQIDVTTSKLSAINNQRYENHKIWSQLIEETNKNTPDKERMNELGGSIRDGLVKQSSLADEACKKYREFISNDAKDFEQRGADINKFCGMMEDYKQAVELDQKALQAILKEDYSEYDFYSKQADEKYLAVSQALSDFQPSPLTAY